MLLLISPAKTQDFQPQTSIKDYTLPIFDKEIQLLVENMRKFSEEDIAKLLKVSQKIALSTHQSFEEFEKSYNLENSKQAILAYKGDVYKNINVESYTKNDMDFAQSHLRIISGLYGLLKPLDLIQPYRLEMGTKLAIKSDANLYQFWGNTITEQINKELENSGSNYVINLASKEYYSAINPEILKGKLIKITFLELKEDKYKVIGTLAKKARGMFTNYVIKQKICKPQELKNFKENGYEFNSDLSCENEFVFTR